MTVKEVSIGLGLALVVVVGVALYNRVNPPSKPSVLLAPEVPKKTGWFEWNLPWAPLK